MGHVNVHVNWGRVGWGMLTFMLTGVGWGGVGRVKVPVHLHSFVHIRRIADYPDSLDCIYISCLPTPSTNHGS